MCQSLAIISNGKKHSAVLQTKTMCCRTVNVIACDYDNTSNMVLASTELLDWDSQKCFAHSLQLGVNNGFKP